MGTQHQVDAGLGSGEGKVVAGLLGRMIRESHVRERKDAEKESGKEGATEASHGELRDGGPESWQIGQGKHMAAVLARSVKISLRNLVLSCLAVQRGDLASSAWPA